MKHDTVKHIAARMDHMCRTFCLIKHSTWKSYRLSYNGSRLLIDETEIMEVQANLILYNNSNIVIAAIVAVATAA